VTIFLSIGQGGSILQGVEFWHSPLTKAAAVNTVLRYRAPAINETMQRYVTDVVVYCNGWRFITLQVPVILILMLQPSALGLACLKPVRRFRRQFVAENSDCRREKCDCRRIRRLSPLSCYFRRQSPFSATVALFCDSVDRATS